MPAESATPLALEFHPVTPERWQDLETLFGKNGAYGGCWCMGWRISRSEFWKQVNQGNREALKAIVDSGEVPGLLAFCGDPPLALCSVGPRETVPPFGTLLPRPTIDHSPI